VAGKLSTRTKSVAATLGAEIRATREKAGLSQEEVAKKIGMTRPNYARIEQGKTNVTIDSLLRIADGLGLELIVDFERARRSR
jgi:transcriptional regulator with XRE-family HTH domain